MLNLTSSAIRLIGTDGPADWVLHPAVVRAADHVRDTYLLAGKRIRSGSTTMETATLQPASRNEIRTLNRFLEKEIERDRAENGGDGMVLVDRDVLRHVDPGLAAHVATPHPDALMSLLPDNDTPIGVSMLLTPAQAQAPPETTDDGKSADKTAYTLYLDRWGVATSSPTTEKIGGCNTWEQLQWMARGAAPFERGGRLWALNTQTQTVLFMADIKLDEDPHARRPENRG